MKNDASLNKNTEITDKIAPNPTFNIISQREENENPNIFGNILFKPNFVSRNLQNLTQLVSFEILNYYSLTIKPIKKLLYRQIIQNMASSYHKVIYINEEQYPNERQQIHEIVSEIYPISFPYLKRIQIRICIRTTNLEGLNSVDMPLIEEIRIACTKISTLGWIQKFGFRKLKKLEIIYSQISEIQLSRARFTLNSQILITPRRSSRKPLYYKENIIKTQLISTQSRLYQNIQQHSNTQNIKIQQQNRSKQCYPQSLISIMIQIQSSRNKSSRFKQN